jgi:competence protein ComEA
MLSVASGLCTLFLSLTAPRAEPPVPRPSAPVAATPSSSEGVVNLNEANPDELERLPGIGPAKAKAIADYRRAHPFKKLDELTKVKGIGKKTLAKLRPYITLVGNTTLKSEVHVQ